MKAQPVMVRRVAAAQATLDRFKDVPFRFGRDDCARMVAFHLRQLGVKVKIAKAGSYSTPLGARAALARAGFASLADALDQHGLLQIAPAAVVVGDIIQLPAEGEGPESGAVFGALTVALGNGRVIGWHPDAPGAVVLQSVAFETAWMAI